MSRHGHAIMPNLARRLTLSGLDQLWVADITYVRLAEGFIHLAAILDAFSRKVIGWALDDHLEASLAIAALERVCHEYGYLKAIRVDQGSEFISSDLDLWAYQRDVVLDFSRSGKPTDNSFIESFNGKFRAECLNAH